MKRNDLSERLLAFAIRVIKLLRKLPDTSEYRIIKYQLTKSSSSAGANYEEAQGASSKADFNNKVHISLKEMRESCYWLKILAGIHDNDELTSEIKGLVNESEELKKILGAICTKVSVRK
jgi:four helix bundle protein